MSVVLDFSTVDEKYTTADFFSRYVRSFVPPWFDMTANRIYQQTGRDFKRCWSWAFEQFMTATNTPCDVGVIGRYSSGLYGDVALGTSSRISDTFRTSFVKTVEWFRHQGWLDIAFVTEYALNICPLDPTLWDVTCAAVPKWWPRAAPGSEIAAITEWSACEALTTIVDGKTRLFAADGTIIPHPERPLISTAFRLLPFAYRLHGGRVPLAKEVADFVGKAFWQKAPTAPRPIAVFEGTFDGWVPFYQDTGQAGDLEVSRLIAHIWSLNVNQWQSWRGVHLPFFPAVSLIDGGRPGHDDLSWFYRNSSDKATFRCADWKIGSLERINQNEYMLHGQYAFVDSDWLLQYLDKSNYRLAFVLTTCMKYRKDRYEEAKVMRQHRLLNFGALII